MTLQVNEIFTSVQGEGVHAGVLATFIRLQGCPVGCSWCDSGPLAASIPNNITKNTWGLRGTEMTWWDILQAITTTHVVITGGEPTMQNLDVLLKALHDRRFYIQLETSGYKWIGEMNVPLVNWITWSPKENLKFQAEGYDRHAHEIKFVVDKNIDLDIIIDIVRKCLLSRDMQRDTYPWITLMPEGNPPGKEMINKALTILEMLEYRKTRLSDRMHYRLGVR